MIIGAGACGIAAFAELFLNIAANGIQKKVKVTWIEKDGKWGHGLAFGTDQPGHLLNTHEKESSMLILSSLLLSLMLVPFMASFF